MSHLEPRGPSVQPIIEIHHDQAIDFSVYRPRLSRSAKIQAQHLRRLAVVYVRQSSPQQVLHHRESTALQYDLRRHAVELGWPLERVLVIDDDQATSGQTAVHRSGYHRLLEEVDLDHVGIILGIEMSRLARSCRDWYHLMEKCALFDTLLADPDGVYDPSNYNDRLLLGLKATMSEAELHILRGRMYQGRLNKARRGEVLLPSPHRLRPNARGRVRPRSRPAGPGHDPPALRQARRVGDHHRRAPVSGPQRDRAWECGPTSAPTGVNSSGTGRVGPPCRTSITTRSMQGRMCMEDGRSIPDARSRDDRPPGGRRPSCSSGRC